MSWLNHPSYAPVRDRLIEYLRSDKYRFRRLSPVVFLCGAADSAPRDVLRNYLAHHPPDVSLFYAEQVWMQIVPMAGVNALEMEDYLGQLADAVIIIVESPGTFAELGAFSLSPVLRNKLLPIVDVEHRNATSFIQTGPIRWINDDSMFAPAIYVNHTTILESVTEIAERLHRIPKATTTRIEDLSKSPKHLVFFICDLIAVIGPATGPMIEHYIKRIVPTVPANQIPTLIGLGVAMDLISYFALSENGTSETYFYRVVDEALTRPFHHQRYLDLPSRRADQVQVLQSIPEANVALQRLKAHL